MSMPVIEEIVASQSYDFVEVRGVDILKSILLVSPKLKKI